MTIDLVLLLQRANQWQVGSLETGEVGGVVAGEDDFEFAKRGEGELGHDKFINK